MLLPSYLRLLLVPAALVACAPGSTAAVERPNLLVIDIDSPTPRSA